MKTLVEVNKIRLNGRGLLKFASISLNEPELKEIFQRS